MSINKKQKAFVAYLIAVCMTLTLMTPIFAYAENSVCTFVADGQAYAATVEPYTNNMGLMVNALDLTKVFGFDAEFNSEDKSVEINSEKYGKVVLMHNATEFYSNDTVYPCAAAFYAENGVPMIEAGFFCAMFGASYTYDENTGIVSLDKNKLSDNVAKVTANDATVPLYITPYHNEYGLVTDVRDLAKAIGATADYDEATGDLVLTDNTKGTIYLKDKATSFTSDYGTFECRPEYFVSYCIPMITVDFFCALYGISYTYVEDTNNIAINTELTMEELYESKKTVPALNLQSETTVSGSMYFNKVPSDGLSVKIIIQQYSYRNTSYYDRGYFFNNTYVIDTAYVTPDMPYFDYIFNPNNYFTTDDYFVLSFEDDDKGFYAYAYSDNYLTTTDKSTIKNNSILSYSFKQYSKDYSQHDVFDVYLENMVTGKIKLPKDLEFEYYIEVQPIIYARNKVFSTTYNSDIYDSYQAYTLNSYLLEPGTHECSYSFNPDYYFNYDQQYFSLFYRVTDDNNNAVMPYGYIDENGNTQTCDKDPYKNAIHGAKAYRGKMSYSGIDINIPANPNYVAPVYPTLSVTSKGASSGMDVSVPVKIENNTGISYIKFDLDWDCDVLTLDSVDGGEIFEDTEIVENTAKDSADATRKYYTFLAYTASGDKTNDGTVATFNFKVKDNINIEDTELNIGEVEAYDFYENYVGIRTHNGILDLNPATAGDITSDGLVNGADLLRLAKHFAGWDVEMNEKAADTNGDGKLNRADLLRLAKYILNPDKVELGK